MNFRLGWLGAALLLAGFSAQAQPDAYYQSCRWQLHTDAVSQATVVVFHDQQNRVIYRETLPGQHIRLTPKNVRRLDDICARLTNHQLVASVLPANALDQPLSGSPETPVSRVSNPVSLLQWPLPDSSQRGFRANVVPSPAFKVAVHYTNAGDEPVSVQLLDPNGHSVYRETSLHLKYKRYLDMGQLALGVYELVLSTTQYRYRYHLRIESGNAQNRPVLLGAFGEAMASPPLTAQSGTLLQ
ncbi:hypothetical protein ACO2Q8_03940 [Larkinella sp. VNQ87]|uniref:hypothetical protein n=1 Tax=Larkinella sp. VNQ87 TaxID=3400921 RepID=UPI003C0897C1